MVVGLDIFRAYFGDFPDQYVIIGGTACDIILSEEGLTARTTDDIDLILIVEALSPEFVKQFWKFIQEGGYERREKSPDERHYYRFIKPANEEFPKQIELFSREPDMIDLPDGAHLTPIPIDDPISNLSAIILNEDYYTYLLEHTFAENGLQIATINALIALKAKAFLNLTESKEKGETIDSRNISKHKGDVFRLAALLTEEDAFDLPAPLKADLQEFIDTINDDLPGKGIFKALGAPQLDPKAVLDQLITSFKLNEEG